LAVDQASAWVDDCYRVVANDEADVGYGVFILRRHVFIRATTDVDAWRNFLGGECVDFARDKRACGFARDIRTCDLARDKRTRVHSGFLREGSGAEEARANAAKARASE
jgi:hypothetical protein